MTQQPVIAVTADSDKEGGLLCDLARRCGGAPLLITPNAIERHDQLALVGGVLMGNSPAASNSAGGLVLRDIMSRLLPTILDFDLPIVAVGNGLHSLNQLMGGRAPVAAPGHEARGDGASARHHVYIAPGSKLAVIVGAGGLVRVNSRHSAGIRDAQRAPDLMASAYAVEDGVIEAVESPDHSLALGVQFRPDRYRETPPNFDNLFHLLVERAGR